MMTPTNDIPLWLDLKKEYVDDNFERLVGYFHKNLSMPVHDSFYAKTRELFASRVYELLDHISSTPLHRDDPDREMLRFNARLLATFILIEKESKRRKEAYAGMLIMLLLMCPKNGDQLLETLGRIMVSENILDPGFSFDQISSFHPEVFIAHLLERAKFDKMIGRALLEGNGRAWLTKDGLQIAASGLSRSEEETRHLPHSLDTGVGCWLATQNSEKLKATDSENLEKILEFVNTFALMQRQPLKTNSLKRLPAYAQGDETIVKVISSTPYAITVVTESEDYQKIKGTIQFYGKNIAYYYNDKFYQYFSPGTRLPVTVLHPEKGLFSFKDQFVRFGVEDVRPFLGSDEPLLGKFLWINENTAFWMTSRGVIVRTPLNPDYKLGEMGWLKIKEICYGPLYGTINAEIDNSEGDPEVDELENETFEQDMRSECIEAFLETVPPAEDSSGRLKNAPLDPLWLRLLMIAFYIHQRTLSSPAERGRFLGNSLAMALLIEDESAHSFLQFTTDYLQAVVGFALGNSLKDTELKVDPDFADSLQVRVRREIIEVLKEYGVSGVSPLLEKKILESPEDMQIVSQVARLVQAANAVSGTISGSSLNLLKREIIRSLSIETGDEVDLEGDVAPYLGLEGQTVEFKTSAVYPPNSNMQPDPTVQLGNIMRAICAFLNSTIGGTLYIGVNDSGYVSGLENDMNYLGRAAYPPVRSFDGYARWLQDHIVKKFGMEIMSYVHIDAAYGERVVVVKIDPHPYRVVDLDGKFYIRQERESREMTEKLKKELAAKKLTIDNNKLAILMNLQHAEFKQQRVKLHDYASATSGKVKDRVVEPFRLMQDHGLLQAFDVDKQEVRIFSLSRIGYVEMLDQHWEFEESHKELPVDAFHMTGETPIEISLQLDLLAKTLMIEEYPLTKNDLTSNKYDPNVWYYKGKVYSMDGLLRFYMGLADHIKIIQAPRLQQMAREAASKLK